MDKKSSFNNLQNKTVLITGAAGVLGVALIEYFSFLDCHFILLNSNKEKMALLANQLAERGIDPACFSVDFRDFQQLSEVVADIASKFKIDILINNAGINLNKDLLQSTPDDVLDEFKINTLAPFTISKIVATSMAERKRGSIINIASIKGSEASSDPGYGMSKAALIQLTLSLAKYFAANNVRVNAIALGIMESEMIKNFTGEKKNQYLEKIALRRFANPSEIAELVAFLASDSASYITGSCFNADGGYKL